MSYRTYINNHEWLGNNEFHKEIYDELVRQGCPFDEDGCVEGFEVKDLDGLVKATERALTRMCKENPNIANFNDVFDGPFKDSITEHFMQCQDIAYIFISVNLLKYVGKLGVDYTREYNNKWIPVYKLTKTGKCIFSAY